MEINTKDRIAYAIAVISEFAAKQSTQAAVLMINVQGMMLLVKGQDYFVSYNRVPWLKDASVKSALNVQLSGRDAICWPDLDIDLEIDSLRHPERYPLVMKRTPLTVFVTCKFFCNITYSHTSCSINKYGRLATRSLPFQEGIIDFRFINRNYLFIRCKYNDKSRNRALKTIVELIIAE